MHHLFWISFIFILYTYILYPAVMLCLAAIRRRAPARDIEDADLPSVTFIVIVFNEENRVLDKIENCRSQNYPRHLLNICIVSDGSTDRTNEILRSQDDIHFISDSTNRGKPAQINSAVRLTQSDVIVFSDVRQQFERDAVRRLVRNFSDPAVGAVSGELVFQAPGDHTEKSIGMYWKYEKAIRKAESDVDSTLGVTGAIYAIRRKLFEPIPDDSILDDVEIPLRAFRSGLRVIFEPAAVAYDTASSSIEREFGRKARTLAGNFQLFSRNLWLLCPFANRIFLQAVSHKLFRLLVPYAMITVLVSSAAIASPAFRALLVIQLLCYGAGIAATLSGALRKNRLLNFLSVFLSLNAASVAGLYMYLFGKADVRWRR
jgi:cellulose synthase/poly-beta-1,6-N-acetylglucosamine synthase-like glycosyltransferase